MMPFSSGRATIRIPLLGRTTMAAALRFRGGRFADASRACRDLSSRGVANIALCPDCELCAGSPIGAPSSPIGALRGFFFRTEPHLLLSDERARGMYD